MSRKRSFPESEKTIQNPTKSYKILQISSFFSGRRGGGLGSPYRPRGVSSSPGRALRRIFAARGPPARPRALKTKKKTYKILQNLTKSNKFHLFFSGRRGGGLGSHYRPRGVSGSPGRAPRRIFAARGTEN